jgi:hypothetical protein
MLRELGFDTSRMQPGQGLDERGFATAQVMWQSWGVANYTQMWGRDGKAVGKAAAAPWAKRQRAVGILERVCCLLVLNLVSSTLP